MEKTELTIAVKKTKNRNVWHEKNQNIATWLPNEDYELLKLLLNLRGINVSQFLRNYVCEELEKNRENLEMIQSAVAAIKSREDGDSVKVIDIA